MSDKVVSINGGAPVPPRGTPNLALVEALEDTLEKARTGELQSLIGTGLTSDRAVFTIRCEGEPDVYAMFGALAWLQADYVQRHIDVVDRR